MSNFLRKKFASFQFPRPFWYLTFGSFLNRAGNFVMPFFALYLTTQRGLSVSQATLIISLMGLGSLASGIIGGVLADNLGRRVTIIAGLAISAVTMFALGCVQSLPLLIVCAIALQFFNQLTRPAFAATVADMVPPEQRAQAYSLRYWANNIGSAIGPTVAGLVAPLSYFALFVGDALTTLIFSVIVWFGVPETMPKRLRERQKEKEQKQSQQFRTALGDPMLWSYSILALIFNCLYNQWMVVLPLDMRAHGLNETYYGLLSAGNAVQVVLISLPLTAYFARLSKNVALAVASLALGLGLGLYAWMHTLPAYALGFAIWTCGEILYYPLSNAIVAAISPVRQRGLYQGVFSTVSGFSAFIAPALGGYIFQYYGAATLWNSCLVIGLLIAGAYVVLSKVQQTIHEKKTLYGMVETTNGD